MAGDHFVVLQETINQATLYNEIHSQKLSWSLFKKYLDNHSGDIGVTFDRDDNVLSVLWYDIIHYSHIVMFFGKPFDQLHPWGPVFRLKNDPEYPHHVFCKFALEYFGDVGALLQLFAAYKTCLCNVYYACLIDHASSSIETQTKISQLQHQRSQDILSKV